MFYIVQYKSCIKINRINKTKQKNLKTKLLVKEWYKTLCGIV
jgi:phosphorylcholine metabolism protein LicD